eukprot:g24235.t1
MAGRAPPPKPQQVNGKGPPPKPSPAGSTHSLPPQSRNGPPKRPPESKPPPPVGKVTVTPQDKEKDTENTISSSQSPGKSNTHWCAECSKDCEKTKAYKCECGHFASKHSARKPEASDGAQTISKTDTNSHTKAGPPKPRTPQAGKFTSTGGPPPPVVMVTPAAPTDSPRLGSNKASPPEPGSARNRSPSGHARPPPGPKPPDSPSNSQRRNPKPPDKPNPLSSPPVSPSNQTNSHQPQLASPPARSLPVPTKPENSSPASKQPSPSKTPWKRKKETSATENEESERKAAEADKAEITLPAPKGPRPPVMARKGGPGSAAKPQQPPRPARPVGSRPPLPARTNSGMSLVKTAEHASAPEPPTRELSGSTPPVRESSGPTPPAPHKPASQAVSSPPLLPAAHRPSNKPSPAQSQPSAPPPQPTRPVKKKKIWGKVFDDHYQTYYYEHLETYESTWVRPAEYFSDDENEAASGAPAASPATTTPQPATRRASALTPETKVPKLSAEKEYNGLFMRLKGLYNLKDFSSLRQVNQAGFLRYTNRPIPKSLCKFTNVNCTDKKKNKLRKLAKDNFSTLLTFFHADTLHDRAAAGMQIICLGFVEPLLRDEVVMQLIKQSTGNPSFPNTMACWRLLYHCVSHFPPSEAFNPYFLAHLANFAHHSYPDPTNLKFNDLQDAATSCYLGYQALQGKDKEPELTEAQLADDFRQISGYEEAIAHYAARQASGMSVGYDMPKSFATLGKMIRRASAKVLVKNGPGGHTSFLEHHTNSNSNTPSPMMNSNVLLSTPSSAPPATPGGPQTFAFSLPFPPSTPPAESPSPSPPERKSFGKVGPPKLHRGPPQKASAKPPAAKLPPPAPAAAASPPPAPAPPPAPVIPAAPPPPPAPPAPPAAPPPPAAPSIPVAKAPAAASSNDAAAPSGGDLLSSLGSVKLKKTEAPPKEEKPTPSPGGMGGMLARLREQIAGDDEEGGDEDDDDGDWDE